MSEAIKGFTGKILRVNLNEKLCAVEEICQEWLEDYIGGVGYAAKLLYDELAPGVDPLGPDNKVILATGPLTMNKIPGGGSLSVCFKSPLTGGWGESRTGGDFGPMLKKAGFDHVIIEGRADSPVYLVIRDGKAELKPADKMVGLTVSEKNRFLHEELSETGFETMAIGPGGENLVRFASVMFGDRAAGRGGAGAVLGSKNLLAAAVKGSASIDEADSPGVKGAAQTAMKVLRENPTSAGFQAAGTIGDMPGNDDGGDWPTKNWQSNSWGKGTEIYDRYEKNNFIRAYGCYRGCYVKCGRKAHVETGPYKTPEHGGAEYESISCFTAYVLCDDVDIAVHSSWLCNEYGIDTISMGSAIAFAMECYEKGIITKEDAGGLELKWGAAETLPKMVEMTAFRQGLGEILAEGVKRASEKLGQESAGFAIHVKGMEGPAHDPRSGKTLAVAYGTAARGMCHIHPVEAMAWDSGKMDWGLQAHGLADPETVDPWDEKGKGESIKIIQDGLILPDILGVCKFHMYAGLTIDHMADMLTSLTGRPIPGADLLLVGERVANLQRLFNIREGFSRKDDMLPDRVKAIPSFGKYSDEPDCAIQDYEGMLTEYYEARGWNPETGEPDESKLNELGLGG